jgi:hypothetical protein
VRDLIITALATIALVCVLLLVSAAGCATVPAPSVVPYSEPVVSLDTVPARAIAYPGSGVYPIGQGVTVRLTGWLHEDQTVDSVTSWPTIGGTRYVYRNGAIYTSGPADFLTVEVTR